MSFYQSLLEATTEERAYLLSAPMIQRCFSGDFTLDHYVAFLQQAYHHVKHTVPLLMAVGAELPEKKEWLREAVAEYIEEELGHQEWILNDIRACGGDAEAVRHGQPGQPIELMVAFLYDQIQRGNPMGFFGMVQVLEGTSVAIALTVADQLKSGLGLPQGALQRTMADYNRDAARGEDTSFHKQPPWLKPLDQAPYAAFDISFDRSIYPATATTLHSLV